MKDAGIETIPMILIYCGFNLVYALFSLVFGKWADRVGRQAVILVSFLIFMFCYAGFAFATTLPEFIFYYAIYGLYMAMSEGVSKALVGGLVPAHLQGTAQGYFGLVHGVSLFFASLVAGLLWEHYGAMAPFLYGAGGAFAAFLAMSFSFRRRQLH
jgi:MFS family permease